MEELKLQLQNLENLQARLLTELEKTIKRKKPKIVGTGYCKTLQWKVYTVTSELRLVGGVLTDRPMVNLFVYIWRTTSPGNQKTVATYEIDRDCTIYRHGLLTDEDQSIVEVIEFYIRLCKLEYGYPIGLVERNLTERRRKT